VVASCGLRVASCGLRVASVGRSFLATGSQGAIRAMIDPCFTRRGFLPEEDPLREFPHDSELAVLDGLGRDLPSLLQDKSFRGWARELRLPALPPGAVPLPILRLYYLRLGFLASAYVNQV